jgi:hypothetical protein
LPRAVGRPRRLVLGNVFGIDSNDADAKLMRGHHHPIGMAFGHAKFRLQHTHDKLARRVVVVDQNDLVQLRPFGFRQNLRASPGVAVTHHRNVSPMTVVNNTGKWSARRCGGLDGRL